MVGAAICILYTEVGVADLKVLALTEEKQKLHPHTFLHLEILLPSSI